MRYWGGRGVHVSAERRGNSGLISLSGIERRGDMMAWQNKFGGTCCLLIFNCYSLGFGCGKITARWHIDQHYTTAI